MTNTYISSYSSRRSQHGTALVIGLLMLTVITILSVSAMRSTNLDTKIAVNHQLKEMTFQAAENALAQVTGPNLDNTNLNLPAALGSENAVTNAGYYQSTDVDGQPDLSADVTFEMMEISRKYKFSGFPLNVLTVMYQADSRGTVVDNDTQTVNRMQVALIRN